MKSYTTLRNLYGVESKNTSTANLAYGDQIMNDFHRKLLSMADWPFLHRLRTVDTKAATSFVNLPYDVDQVESVFITIGATRYNPKPVPSRKFWDDLHYSQVNSDTPEYWFIYNGQIGVWPVPVSAGNTISLNTKIRVTDLAVADYTTGTITTTVNGDETVVLNGTALTNPMTGRWLSITLDDEADAGDGLWYEISSITDATNLELVRGYGGTSITAGAQAFTIGQMPLLPEAYHGLLSNYAAYKYWSKENDIRKDELKSMVADGISGLFKDYSMSDLSMVVDDGRDDFIINPNLTVTL